MNYLEQLNAFADYSEENLNPMEVAVYMRLMFMNNQLHWKEWFSISYRRLALKLNIQTDMTIKNAINSLKQKGYIKIKPGKGATPNQYSIVKLYTLKNEVQSIQNQSINNPKSIQDQSEINPKTLSIIKQDKTRQDETKTPAAADAGDPNFGEVVSAFSDNIHPVSGTIELETLGELYDRYGKEWLLCAVREAALNHARSVKYLITILERWEREGFNSSKPQQPAARATNANSEPRGIAELRAIMEGED